MSRTTLRPSWRGRGSHGGPVAFGPAQAAPSPAVISVPPLASSPALPLAAACGPPQLPGTSHLRTPWLWPREGEEKR